MRLTATVQTVGRMTKKYSNLPERYIKRAMEEGHVAWKTPNAPQYLPRVIKKTSYHFGVDRCWTGEFHRLNDRSHPKVYLKPIENWSFFHGDLVQVLEGKDKGKQGVVCQIIEERNWVMVEGLNCKNELFGKTTDYPGTMMLREIPLVVDDEVALVDPSDDKPCEVEWRFTEEGEQVRVSTRSGRIIPMPTQADETYDFKSADTYKESEKDTKADDVTRITFRPALKTFEMDITESCGVDLGPEPKETYWY